MNFAIGTKVTRPKEHCVTGLIILEFDNIDFSELLLESVLEYFR